jgi:16S rRNA (guanine(966)-N(2))-methyltransferase RsmD
VREALFNVLGDKVAEAEVWDLFAGTGASGIEALSRGAARVLFLEKSNQALTVLRSNLDLLGPEVKERCHVLKQDAWAPGPLTPEGEEIEVPPDLIFLDPPYKAVGEDPGKALYRAQELVKRLAPDGLLCFHFLEGHLDLDDFDPVLNVDLRHWGSSMLAIIGAGKPASDPD